MENTLAQSREDLLRGQDTGVNIEIRKSYSKSTFNYDSNLRISIFEFRIYLKFLMRKIVLLIISSLFLISSAFSQETRTNDKRIVELEPQFEKVLKDWKAVGFAVVVVNRNKIIYEKGFGYRDYDKKIPVTPNTLFAIGSCTKAFTASLIGMLDNDKQLDIDKPVHNYLPDLAFYNNGMTDNITLRDMMSHRTGLPRHDYSWYLFSTSSRRYSMQFQKDEKNEYSSVSFTQPNGIFKATKKK